MPKTKRKLTTDAVAIIHRRYYEGKPDRLAALEQARANDDVARKIAALRAEAGLSQRQQTRDRRSGLGRPGKKPGLARAARAKKGCRSAGGRAGDFGQTTRAAVVPAVFRRGDPVWSPINLLL